MLFFRKQGSAVHGWLELDDHVSAVSGIDIKVLAGGPIKMHHVDAAWLLLYPGYISEEDQAPVFRRVIEYSRDGTPLGDRFLTKDYFAKI